MNHRARLWVVAARAAVVVGLALLVSRPGVAQTPSTVPPEGLRENTPAVHALVNARIVTAPGRAIERGTLVIRDGMIAAVGPADAVAAPADARVWDLAGKTIYPGLIEPYSELGATDSGGGAELLRPAGSGAAYWNPRVRPHVRADHAYKPDADLNRKLRSQGIVARLVAPGSDIIKGTSAAVSTGDGDASRAILRPVVAMHLQLSARRGEERAYPTSPMGAVALVRQAMYDAQWYAKAHDAWNADPSLARPERNDALDALRPVIEKALPAWIDAPDEQYAMRADSIAREFELDAVLRGSGQEYRRLDLIASTKRPIVVPVNFPKPPNVATPEAALGASLEDLLNWDLAPENASRLQTAGARIALTGHGLKDRGAFLSAVRKAVARGLPPEAALAALTTRPAEMLGLSKTHGTIEAGKSASLVVASGDLFAEKTKVLETWVDGRRYEVTAVPKEDPRGTWAVRFGGDGGERTFAVTISGEPAKLKGRLVAGAPATQPASGPAPATGPATRPAGIELTHVALMTGRLGFAAKGEPLGLDGVVQVSVAVEGDAWLGSAVQPDGRVVSVSAQRTGAALAATDDADEKADDDKGAVPPVRESPPPSEREKPTTGVVIPDPPPGVTTQPASPKSAKPGDRGKASTKPALYDVNYPLGAFGRRAAPQQPAVVLFVNATIWPCDGRKPFVGTVRVESGKITQIVDRREDFLPDLQGIAGAVIVDCEGKHLTPGMIDCHSHIATDGGVNETGQTITCEVRIGDFLDATDINIYRQLAGGTTSSNILHGSANTIGGQNQVIKMRWGAASEDLKFTEAPPGVKFALGENVKQANWGERFTTRYPQTRMGVEQLVGDAFTAARAYRQQWDAYRKAGKGIPPRHDLELEALSEIVEGKRFIHCHSYRQDEILAFLRTCERFGVKVATLQHVLEGYKVAETIGKHGAGGSSFSDWWAYKFEVYDAIPYNGALMHNEGVVVSFNSDSAELARRLNTEAAKAVKYGGVSEEEAIKFVTLNPAKQLGIDRYVGSIEPGKHADLVVWSGPPLSTLSRCEQTWVDGRKYFDRAEDTDLRKRDAAMKAALVQKVLAAGDAMAGDADEDERKPRDVWARDDVFCGKCDYGRLRR